MLLLRRHAAAVLLLALPAALAQEPLEENAADPNDPGEEIIRDAAAHALPPLEDYEASEQISEDLSVSFPVDI